MLVLSRKVGESIVVGDQIEVVIFRVAHGRLKIGLRAPKEMRIRRGELLTAEEKELLRNHELVAH